jgi:RNA polymerase sigma-70 factor (ECF subfamily)
MGDSVSGSKPAVASREAVWRQYVDHCAAGDQSALAALYDESSSLVHSLTNRMLGNAADADEVTLDVYTQVWRTAATYDQARGSVASWLVTLARSRAIDRTRSRASRVKREQPILDFTSFEAATASPEQQIAFSQRSQRVQAALATLSPEQSEALQLAFFSDLSHSELAERLGQPLGTVKSRIRSGMMKLRMELEPFAYD